MIEICSSIRNCLISTVLLYGALFYMKIRLLSSCTMMVSSSQVDLKILSEKNRSLLARISIYLLLLSDFIIYPRLGSSRQSSTK